MVEGIGARFGELFPGRFAVDSDAVAGAVAGMFLSRSRGELERRGRATRTRIRVTAPSESAYDSDLRSSAVRIAQRFGLGSR